MNNVGKVKIQTNSYYASTSSFVLCKALKWPSHFEHHKRKCFWHTVGLMWQIASSRTLSLILLNEFCFRLCRFNQGFR